MDKQQIEYHLNKSLISNRKISTSETDDKPNTSRMNNLHKVLLTLFLCFLGAIAIASQAKIDIAVSVRGELLLESDVEKIQHLEGGILEELMIRKGDVVYAGQPIAKIKSTERASQLDTVQEEIIQLKLDNIRYQSLRDMIEPDFSYYEKEYPNLVKININTWKKEYKKNISNENLVKHDITHKKSLIKSMKDRTKSSLKQLALIREQLNIKNTLYKEEMASYIEVLNIRVQESNMQREIENLNESIMNEKFQLNKLEKQYRDIIENRISEYQAMLIEIEKKLNLKNLEYPNISDKVQRLIIHSPIDGIVDKINFNFQSAIIKPGDSIADISPINNRLHAEAKIPRKEMGFIEQGQEVKLKMDTYNFTSYGYINGTIKSISRSSYEEDESEFYLAEIELEKTYLVKNDTTYNLSPYMEFTADIKTGSRKLIDYAAKPIISAIESAFDER